MVVEGIKGGIRLFLEVSLGQRSSRNETAQLLLSCEGV